VNGHTEGKLALWTGCVIVAGFIEVACRGAPVLAESCTVAAILAVTLWARWMWCRY
jgi:hypothetical protein